MEANQTLFERIEAFLYSRKFIFLVVIAGTVPMIMHSHQLFFQISPFEGSRLWKNTYALFYAISFDLTILVFTIHYIKRKPQLYSVFVFVINLLYYNPFEFIPVEWMMGFTKIFIAGVLAFTGYSYSELFVEKVAENRKKERKNGVYKKTTNDVNIQSTIDEFKCNECGRRFASIKALNGHMVAHRN
ncbi:C2H2-type zinc finger protein [Aquimarina sp. U1-2]|uniref:C2H2-type zinc finger protein n=1 Tax=Aquimarina sp. U1-2 TaxID=2823141 RepID=UPI001AED0798|nr:C2H2-type zinc finger protein [Aquimarina sp. U1-2]MBP2831247.1 C2H2-type zinc finger protein [Aquimarina sp. U1-2]